MVIEVEGGGHLTYIFPIPSRRHVFGAGMLETFSPFSADVFVLEQIFIYQWKGIVKTFPARYRSSV